MILSGVEIRRLAEGGVGANGERIVIEPFDPARCGPASYDVTLAGEIRVYDTETKSRFMPHRVIDPNRPTPTSPKPLSGGDADPHWVLVPGRVYLGSTTEYTETHGLVPMLHGRSSIGRLGLFIHVTAGVGDPGFCGYWTLELVVVQPVIVRPNIQIDHLTYHTMTNDILPYNDRYQNQTREPGASRYHMG